jgi:hypothetical protein|tara:strand:- start:3261 stop:3476 length:216 start_codon:yes stop_codon:yes gene_type:complete
MKRKINNNHTVYTYSNFREVKTMDIDILLDSKNAELELLKSADISKYLKCLEEIKEIEKAISVLKSHGVIL